MKIFWTTKFVLVGVISCIISMYTGGACEEIPKKELPDTKLQLPPNEEPQAGVESALDVDADRLKRAQGPITELYGCLVTLFLNPLCWNKFENNRLRYLQYLYLRRKLQMMEDAMKKNQTAPPAHHPTPERPRGSVAAAASPARPAHAPVSTQAHASQAHAPPSQPRAPQAHVVAEENKPGSRLGQIKMRLFPRSYARLKEMRKMARGLQQQVMTQAQQLFVKGMGQAQQLLKRPKAAAQTQAQFPMIMMRT